MKKIKYILPIRCILFILIFILGSIITNKELNNISNWWSVVASIVNIITIVILVLVSKKMNISYSKLINYEKGKTKIKQVVIMSIIILILGTMGMYIAGFICYNKFPYLPSMMIEPIPVVLAIINFIVLPLTVSFAEDGLYLGCGVNQIDNKYCSIIVPAFFYALQHSFIPTLFDGKFIIYRFLSFLPLTILLCWYYKKNRNPVPIMIGHALIEVASVVMILITSISPDLYQAMLNM